MKLENYQKDRLPFIDLLKGICIILVVYGHIDTRLEILSTFRMPLYYFLAGLFFSRDKSFLVFSIKKINRIIIPFIFFSLLGIVFRITGHLFSGSFFKIAEMFVLGDTFVWNPPLWFLLSLFEGLIFYYFISAIKNIYIQSIIVLLVSYLGYSLDSLGVNLYFYFDTSMTILIFIHAGFSLKSEFKDAFLRNKYDSFVTIILFITYSYMITLSKPTSFFQNHYQSSFLTVLLAAFSGLLFFFFISKLICKVSIINFIGRYSIVTFGMHMLIIEALYYFIPKLVYYPLVVLFLVLLVSIAFTLLVRRIYPQFIAQAPLLKFQNGVLYFNFRKNTIKVDKVNGICMVKSNNF